MNHGQRVESRREKNWKKLTSNPEVRLPRDASFQEMRDTSVTRVTNILKRIDKLMLTSLKRLKSSYEYQPKRPDYNGRTKGSDSSTGCERSTGISESTIGSTSHLAMLARYSPLRIWILSVTLGHKQNKKVVYWLSLWASLAWSYTPTHAFRSLFRSLQHPAACKNECVKVSRKGGEREERGWGARRERGGGVQGGARTVTCWRDY